MTILVQLATQPDVIDDEGRNRMKKRRGVLYYYGKVKYSGLAFELLPIS